MNTRSIKSAALIGLLLMFSFFRCSLSSYASDPGISKTRVAVFPFNDVRLKSADMNVSSVLKAELMNHEFIDIVPVEVIREKVYEIEPAFLWTGRKGTENRGGILWRFEPRIIEEVDRRVSADLSVYGDITRFGQRWRIDVYIIRKGLLNPESAMVITGTKGEEIPEKLREVAQKIINGIIEENIRYAAEEDIRKYMGGIYSYTAVIEKIRGRLVLLPDSVALHSLLLDLYLKEKGARRDEAFNEGLKIIELYDPSRDDDTRYLLSLSMDPFDAVAEVYEARKEWMPAIETRIRALAVFPYNAQGHREAIGRDHYFMGLYLEEKGDVGEALKNYKESLVYLSRSSEHYAGVNERIKKISGEN